MIECFSTEEFLIFRKALGPASGAESTQFRIIEILAGLQPKSQSSETSDGDLENDDNNVLEKNEKFYWENLIPERQQLADRISTLLNSQNKNLADFKLIYAQVKQSSLRSMFMTIVSQRLSTSKDAVELFEKLLFENQEKDLIELAKKLLKMETSIIDWKRMHLKISAKHLAQVNYGTGGSDWVKYLNKSITEQRYFPELYLANQNIFQSRSR